MTTRSLTDALSKTALHVTMFLDETQLGQATGFAYKHDGSIYFVTARHNFTGRHATTNQPLSKTGACPNRIVVALWDRERFGRWQYAELRLYDSSGNPSWLEHPQYQGLVDVAALPVRFDSNLTCYPINEHSFDAIRLSPGLDVFVLGFPMGLSSGGKLPLWKRGSIASEPEIDIDSVPKLLIDTATRSGLSGSPVIAQRVGYWLPEGETDLGKAVMGEGRRFLGVYSGRVGDDEFQAQLGIVWKESAIVEILKTHK